MIDLSKNTNPYYPSKELKKHLIDAALNVNFYPHKDFNYVNQIFSSYFDIDEKNITITVGTLGAFDNLIKVLKVKKIGFLSPTFWGMQNVASQNKCKLVYSNATFNYSLESISKLAKKVDMIYICNPNNPTLAYLSRKNIINLLKDNRNCHFVIDETLLSFSPDYKKQSLYKEVNKYQNLSVMISFSKIFSLGGLRLALLFSNKNTIEKIKENNVMFSVNLFIENVAEYLGKNYFKIDRNIFQRNFYLFKQYLTKKHIEEYVDVHVSFVNIKFKNYVDINKMLNYLRENGFIIADLSSMYIELEKKWVRVSIGKSNEMKKLAKLINNFLEVNYDKKINYY